VLCVSCDSVLQCVAVCCSVLQCVAVCCSVLQCVALCCSVLQCMTVCVLCVSCDSVCCERRIPHSVYQTLKGLSYTTESVTQRLIWGGYGQ